ncbi:MAG: CHAT domain-containing protein [Lewinellaceae bacterium]|nr:CHAT domain-containing protein [Saprospiraceae bacterium]MCB9337780.1 CHAT domain-containing protein [Lewinellaceae bacterium]
MKTILNLSLFLLSNFLSAQTIDSTAIRQVDSLIGVSRTLAAKSDFEQALEVNAEAEKIALEKLGRESAAYANCCNNRGTLMYYIGDYENVEKWWIEAKAIREEVLGKEHPDYAASLNNLAALYWSEGNYKEAESLYLEAIAIREKKQGKEHPDYAGSLSNLAALYDDMGAFEKAEIIYDEAIAIRRKMLGKEHPKYASSLNGLAILFMHMGAYEKAEPYYLEAKAIWEKTLGKEHPDYAKSLNNLAILYYQMGQYEKAEEYYLEAKAIIGKTLGKEHPEYAASLSNLANLYMDMGQYEKAEQCHLEAIAIRENALGKEHPEYAESLNNLAILYGYTAAFKKAELLFIETNAIREKILGKEHPEYANGLQNLAAICMDLKQYEKAEQLSLEAIAILEKTLGKENPNFASALSDLAENYSEVGKPESAEQIFLECKTIQENTLGKEHPDYVLSLNNLAGLYWNMGKYEMAEPLFLELSAVNKHSIEKSMHHLSERELNNYLNRFSQSQNQILSFAQNASSKKLIPVCYDNSLFYKGFLFKAASQVKRLSLSDSTTTEKYNLLKSYERRLAMEYSQPIAERDSAKAVELEEKANDLEKDLTRTVAGYGQAMRQVDWQEVQQALKPDEAAIEFVHYHYYDKKQTDSTMYSALLLRPGDEQPVFIPLFEEKQLAAAFAPGTKEQPSELLAQVYSRGAQPLKTAQLAGLYQLIWQPLDSLLSKTTTVYFSPAGLLHRINFGAIPFDKNQILSDKYRLVRLGSTRSLVVPDLTKNILTNSAALFGGIHYEMDSTATTRDTIENELLAARSGELSFAYADRSAPQRGDNWGFLSGTEKEVSQIQSLLQSSNFSSQVLSGENATEEAFKTLGKDNPSPRILHIATHGFFFPDPKEARSTGRGLREAEPVFKISDHPMIRSGLILAGGNYAWKNGKPLRPGMEDGILTAYEISQMDLSNTEIVVLSACETGLGDIQGNEGVYGLQRAFKIAGAKYLVMSLWQVPDQETSVFMTTFYKNWLQGKMAIPDAFRSTQQEMRERFVNPYQWAGFVLVE